MRRDTTKSDHGAQTHPATARRPGGGVSPARTDAGQQTACDSGAIQGGGSVHSISGDVASPALGGMVGSESRRASPKTAGVPAPSGIVQQVNEIKAAAPMPGFRVRAGQAEFEAGVRRYRVCALVGRRQYGKTTIASRIALRKMMEHAGHTVIFASVKLDLGREIVRKEAELLQKTIAAMGRDANGLLDVVDVTNRKSVKDLTADDFAELYETSRLELRLYHSNTVFSRTKVVAATTSSVGDTGDLILDEVGRVRDFRAVWEALAPIIASNPEFRAILTTTPPPDDSHFSFELLGPPIGTDLPVNPRGNWYRSDLGMRVLRVTAWDAYADGVPLFDDESGAPMDPGTARGKAPDKDAWDRNYGCRFVMGGTSACGLLLLDTAQRRGVGQCRLVQVQEDADLDGALEWLGANLGSGKVGVGWDLATTTSETSNPSAIAVVEAQGAERIARLVLTWKVADPDVAMERISRVLGVIASRAKGGRARRLSIDATNERYFAQSARKALSASVPVELVIGSETIQPKGQPEPMTMKQFLGGRLVGELEDNHLTLPAERFLREDWRLVRKERGQFVCEPDSAGRHGDTFDATKLALWSLESMNGGWTSEALDAVRMPGRTGVRTQRGETEVTARAAREWHPTRKGFGA